MQLRLETSQWLQPESEESWRKASQARGRGKDIVSAVMKGMFSIHDCLGLNRCNDAGAGAKEERAECVGQDNVTKQGGDGLYSPALRLI